MTVYRVIRTVCYTVLNGRLSKWAIQHQVVETVPAGPCVAPIRVTVGGEAALVACGRRLPPERRCPACTVRIEVVDVRRVVATPPREPDRRSLAASSSGVA